LEPIAPAFNAGAIVIVTSAEDTVPHVFVALRLYRVVVVSAGGVYESVLAPEPPAALTHVEPLYCCHWYVIAPMPPLAAVVDVNAPGSVPEQIDRLEPIAPASNAGAIVIVTSLEDTVPQVFVALRLYCVVAVSAGGV